SSKKLRMYSSGKPVGVRITTISELILLRGSAEWQEGANYITFENSTFEGSNNSSIHILRSTNTTIQYCDFNFSGVDGITGPFGGNSSGLNINNCTFNNSNNCAINIQGDFTNAHISGNNVK